MTYLIIKKFVCDTPAARAGAEVTLTWETNLATSIQISSNITGPVSVSPSLLNGSVVVTLASTGAVETFTISAAGVIGTASSTVDVRIVSSTSTFVSASPLSIIQGDYSALVWKFNVTSTESKQTRITGPGVSYSTSSLDEANEGYLVVQPSITTTYNIEWDIGFVGTPGVISTSNDTEIITVIPAPLPTITFLEDRTVAAGEPFPLLWNVIGATSVSLDQGIGAIDRNGSAIVTVEETTVFTLTAVGPGGTATAQVTITVLAVPTIDFTATPDSITAGESSTLSWTVTGADSISIDNGIGSVASVDSLVRVFPLSGDYTFTLTATNAMGSSTKEVTVHVAMALPVIVSFTATPPTLDHHGHSVLAWEVTGEAVTVSIDQGIGTVALTGSTDTEEFVAEGVKTYTLTATNAAGEVTAQATVTVDAPDLVILNDSPLPSIPILDPVVLVQFLAEGGFGDYTWSADGLPSGTSLDTNTGVLSGIIDEIGVYIFDITVHSPGVPSTTKEFELQVVHVPVEITTELITPDPRENVPYVFQMESQYGVGSNTWSIAGGSLPPGLTLGADGKITGTPEMYGYWDVSIRVDSGPDHDIEDYEVTVRLGWDRLDPFHNIFYRILEEDGTYTGITNDPYPERGGMEVFGRLVVAFTVGVNDFTITDTRQRGGGLAPEHQNIDEAQHFWDLGYWDGRPVPAGGVQAVYLPLSVLNRFSREEIQAKVEAIAPLGTLPLVRFYDAQGDEQK